MTPQFTSENVLTVVYIGAILFLIGAGYGCSRFLKQAQNGLSEASEVPATRLFRYSHLGSARAILSFVLTLNVVAIALALGLGHAKIIADFAQFFLPDRFLGFAVLIGYCGLAIVYDSMKDDVRRFLKGLIGELQR